MGIRKTNVFGIDNDKKKSSLERTFLFKNRISKLLVLLLLTSEIQTVLG